VRSAPEAPRQLLRDAQLMSASSSSAAARALQLAEEARDVAAATLGELGTQSDALRGVAVTLSEAEAHVDASERTLDDINTGCFGCFGPRKRLARRRWRGGGDDGSAEGKKGGGSAAAPAAAAAAGRVIADGAQLPRRASSAKAIAARAKLPSSALQSARGAGAGAGAAASSPSSSRHSNNADDSLTTALFEDAALSREAAVQDRTLQQIDAAVRAWPAAQAALARACTWVLAAWCRVRCVHPVLARAVVFPFACIACSFPASSGDGAGASVRAHRRGAVATGAAHDDRRGIHHAPYCDRSPPAAVLLASAADAPRSPCCQAPVLEALHERADELGHRFRGLNTTGKMGKIKLKRQSSGRRSSGGGGSSSAPSCAAGGAAQGGGTGGGSSAARKR
jgi:uncharacterized membrane protein YgcG